MKGRRSLRRFGLSATANEVEKCSDRDHDRRRRRTGGVRGTGQAAGAALAVLLVAACGSGGARSTSATSANSVISSPTTSLTGTTATTSKSTTKDGTAVDACRLVTQSEAETAIGGPVGPAKLNQKAKGGGTSCTYAETPQTADSGNLTIGVVPSGSTGYQAAQANFTDKHPLPGIGDEGFLAFSANTAGGNAVFRVGSTLVLISLGSKGSAAVIPAKLQAMAAAAVRRV